MGYPSGRLGWVVFCQKASVDTPFIPFTRNIFRTKKYHSLISESPYAPNHLISNTIPQWRFSFLFTKKYHRSIIEVSLACIKLLDRLMTVLWLYSSCIHGLNNRLVMSKIYTLIFPTAWGTEPPNVGFHSPLCGENTDGLKGILHPAADGGDYRHHLVNISGVYLGLFS